LFDAGTDGGLSLDAVNECGISVDAGTSGGTSLDAGTGGGLSLDAANAGGISLDAGTSGGTPLDDGTGGGLSLDAGTSGVPSLDSSCQLSAMRPISGSSGGRDPPLGCGGVICVSLLHLELIERIFCAAQKSRLGTEHTGLFKPHSSLSSFCRFHPSTVFP